MKTDKILASVVALLVAAQAGLVFLSWFMSATTGRVHSLLSAEGVRWFCSSFASMLASPILTCLLLLSMAWGSLRGSGLLHHLNPNTHHPTPNTPSATRLALVTLLVCVLLILMLSVVPHAILLSATGHLWPSPFSRALVPMVALTLIVVSAVYGRSAHIFQSFTDIVSSWTSGVSTCAPLIVLYIFIIQFYESLLYVFL